MRGIPPGVSEEAAADISGEILNTPEMLEYIGARNAEAANGINGFLTRTINKLKGKPSAQEAYDMLSESQKALIDGMEANVEAEEAGTVSYSLMRTAVEQNSRPFAEQFADYKAGKMAPTALFALGNTSKYLQTVGIANEPIVMAQSVVAKAQRTSTIDTHGHGLSDDILLKLPDMIKKPVLLLKSDTVQNAVVIVTSTADTDGNPVVVALHLNRKNGFDVVTRVASLYGRKNSRNFLSDQMLRGNLIGYSKKEADRLLHRDGLQLPRRNTAVDFDNINVPQGTDVVNPHSMQETENDAQGDFSLMEDDQYKADIEKAVADAIARSEADLKASQDEINNLRKQLSDLKNQAKKDAKANDRWRDAEAKLIADIAAAKEREKAAKEKAEYFKKREEIIGDERLNAAVRNERSKQRNRLREADKKSTTTDDVARVLTEVPEKSAETRKRIFFENWRAFKREWVNTKDELERFGALVGDEQIMYAANNLGQASAAAQYSIGGSGQYDLNGKKIGDKNLTQVFAPAKEAGLIGDFYTYLLHEHNIDRMDIRNKAQKQLTEFRQKQNGSVSGFSEFTDEDIIAAASNDSVINYSYTEGQQRAAKEFLQFRKWAENQFDKPVFGSSVTAEDSRSIADKLLDQHPEFKEWAKDVYAYSDNLMTVRKQAGLVSEDLMRRTKELYPHYVPIFRDMVNTSGGYYSQNSISIDSTVEKAKGGNQNIMPIIDSMARQTMQVFSAAKKNVLGNMLYNDAMSTNKDISEFIQSIDEDGELVDIYGDIAEKLDNTLSIYVDGKPVTLHISSAMADGFKAIQQSNATGMKLLRSANSIFKKLVTQWNPVFIVRNFVRDAQSALYFTHYSNATFVKNYGRAVKEITSNGKYWQLYQAMGGKGTTYYDPKTGLVDRKHFDNAVLEKASEIKNKIVGILSAANESVEQFPRLAEFISTMEATGDVQKALYNAADITTNFGRGGFAARKLNATLVPFFNPGMQGLSKNIRNVIDRKGAKEIGQLISRLLINGVMPGLIMSFLYDGLKEDKEYQELSNYIKDSNILIKVSKDKFIKIPMGREPSVITAFTNRVWRWIGGEPAEKAFAEYPKFAIEQIAPNNPLSNNIFSGIYSMTTNKNWYGGDIVSQYMEERPNYLQYDEATDAFSIWLGEITKHGSGDTKGISPKKANYLIDQYSGFLGDYILPALSKKADIPAFAKAFVVDSVRQNRLSSDFYDALDVAKAVTYEDECTAADSAVYSYLYKQSKAASDITKQLREIYNSESSRQSKMKEATELLELRNEIYRNALETVSVYERNAKSINSVDAAVVKREANAKTFGYEYALYNINKATGEKAARYVADGVTWEQYYNAYVATRDLDGGAEKKAAIDKAVSNANQKQKNLLYDAFNVAKKYR